jgi:hypothetical protein
MLANECDLLAFTDCQVTVLPAPVFTLASVPPAQIEVNRVYTLIAQTNLKPSEVVAEFQGKGGKSLDVSVSSSGHKRSHTHKKSEKKEGDKKEDKQEVCSCCSHFIFEIEFVSEAFCFLRFFSFLLRVARC